MIERAEQLRERLEATGYLCAPALEVATFLAWRMEKPLLVEGPAGAGKTQLAIALSEALEAELIRLQCYEGLDSTHALYEWNYHKQILRLQSDRLRGAAWEEVEEQLFSPAYLLARPLLQALTCKGRAVLLIDEVDKADEEFEAFLLEFLGEFQVTIPEYGVVRAQQRPLVVLTSNRTRELSAALRRRCLYLFLDFPSLELERKILRRRVPDLPAMLLEQVVRFVHALRQMQLRKHPSVAEGIDWARALVALGIRELQDPRVRQTLGVLLKSEEDLETANARLSSLVAAAQKGGRA
jgi:MoxR-like ATPase